MSNKPGRYKIHKDYLMPSGQFDQFCFKFHKNTRAYRVEEEEAEYLFFIEYNNTKTTATEYPHEFLVSKLKGYEVIKKMYNLHWMSKDRFFYKKVI
jgi:hypothetical protein